MLLAGLNLFVNNRSAVQTPDVGATTLETQCELPQSSRIKNRQRGKSADELMLWSLVDSTALTLHLYVNIFVAKTPDVGDSVRVAETHKALG